MLIAQITDAHIVPKGSHWLSEPLAETEKRLSRAVAFINDSNPVPDVVLMTGDLTDDGSPEAYAHFRELVRPLKPPLFVIPGNHDRREAMRAAFSDQSYMPKEGFLHYVIDDYPVRLIGLDTLVEGEVHGLICEERLAWLETSLSDKPALIFMHHSPAKTGSKLFDTILCRMSDRFEEIIRRRTGLLGIIAGHYHLFCAATFGGRPCLTAPSLAPVCYFASPSDEHATALELHDPSVVFHQWLGGDAMASHVFQVKESYRRLDWKAVKAKMNLSQEPVAKLSAAVKNY